MNTKRTKTGSSRMACICLLTMAAMAAAVARTPVNIVLTTINGLNSPSGVVVSPDSSTTYVAQLGSNYLAVIDAATYSVTQYGLTGLDADNLALSKNGETLWVSDLADPGYAIGFSTANFQTTAWLSGSQEPGGLVLSPNGRQLYVASQLDNKVYVYSTAASGSLIKSIEVGTAPRGVAFAPNGKRAYVTNRLANTVSVIDVANGTVEGSPISVDEEPSGINISPNGKTAYTTNMFSVSVIDLQTNQVTATINTDPYNDSNGNGLFSALTPDGKYLYLPLLGVNFGDGSVLVIKTANNTVVSQFSVGIEPHAIAIAPDGQRAYVTNRGDVTAYGSVSVVGITE